MATNTTPETKKPQAIPACPACSSTRGFEVKPLVYRCAKCDGLFSNNIYLGESYEFVLPFMTAVDVPAEQIRYFDFTCLGSKGITRRHGWYDPSSRLIVQVG